MPGPVPIGADAHAAWGDVSAESAGANPLRLIRGQAAKPPGEGTADVFSRRAGRDPASSRAAARERKSSPFELPHPEPRDLCIDRLRMRSTVEGRQARHEGPFCFGWTPARAIAWPG